LLLVAVLVVSTVALLPSTPVRRYSVPLSPGIYALAGVGAVTLAERFRRLRSGEAEEGEIAAKF